MHPPFEAGQCSGCHVPHASDTKNLVAGKGTEVCMTCHADVLGSVTPVLSTHLPVKQDCVACHEPHGSAIQGQLKRPQKELCLTCHTKLGEAMKKAKANVHPPAAKGECSRCHTPHESRHRDLLKAAVPGVCTTCHAPTEAKIVKAHGGLPIKDASCTGCHEPHVADGAGLFHPVGHKPFLGKVCSACHK